MELDGGRPLTRGQLDIWLAQEAALAGTDWQLGLLGRIAGRVDRDHLHDAIRLVVREAEPGRAAFFVTAGQILQRAIDYPDVQLDFYDLTGSEDTAREVGEIASSIRRKPMPLAGPLFKFALFQTSPDEFYLFACCHHIAMDGLGMVLVSRRIAAIYSALVAGEPVPPSYFGSLNDLVEEESAYEASPDYLEDRNYWSTHLPPTTQRTTGLRSSPRGMTAPPRPCRSPWIPPSSGRPRNFRRNCGSGGIRCSLRRALSWWVAIAPQMRWR